MMVRTESCACGRGRRAARIATMNSNRNNGSNSYSDEVAMTGPRAAHTATMDYNDKSGGNNGRTEVATTEKRACSRGRRAAPCPRRPMKTLLREFKFESKLS